jgi:hypothetical protein
MARTKGSKNKQPHIAPRTLSLATEERIQLIANLIVDTMEARKHTEMTAAQEFDNA